MQQFHERNTLCLKICEQVVFKIRAFGNEWQRGSHAKKNRFPTGKWKIRKARGLLTFQLMILRSAFHSFVRWMRCWLWENTRFFNPGWEILLPFHRFFGEVLVPFHRFFLDHWLPSGKLQIWWTHSLNNCTFQGGLLVALRLLEILSRGEMQNYTLFASKHQGWHFSHVVLQRWKNSFKLEKKEEYYV